MDFFEVVGKRRSYRGIFHGTPVSIENLRRIVEAALAAPSGCNMQTTTFVIVNDETRVRQIQGMHTGNKAMQTAKAYVACVVDKTPAPAYEGFSFQAEDCAAAVENMLLAATALGYASVWIDGWLRSEGRAEKVGAMLGVPEGKIIRVILPIGVPQDNGAAAPEKKPFNERAWFNTYGRK